MRKFLALVALFATPAPLALAQPLSVTLDDADQQAMVSALDAYVKSGGINVALSAVVIMQKLQEALKKGQADQAAATVTGDTKK